MCDPNLCINVSFSSGTGILLEFTFQLKNIYYVERLGIGKSNVIFCLHIK